MRPSRRVFVTAVELLGEPGSTEHGVDVPRFALGGAVGYMPVDRLHLGAGLHAGIHMLVRKSNADDGFEPVNGVIWRSSLGASGTVHFDLFEVAERHWITLGVRGDVDWVFKTVYRSAALNVGYAFK